MTENVVAIRANIRTGDERKSLFLDAAANSFDQYVEDFGETPDSMVWVLGGIAQRARSGWVNSGKSEGGATSMLALAMSVIMKDIINP